MGLLAIFIICGSSHLQRRAPEQGKAFLQLKDSTTLDFEIKIYSCLSDKNEWKRSFFLDSQDSSVHLWKQMISLFSRKKILSSDVSEQLS